MLNEIVVVVLVCVQAAGFGLVWHELRKVKRRADEAFSAATRAPDTTRTVNAAVEEWRGMLSNYPVGSPRYNSLVDRLRAAGAL